MLRPALILAVLVTVLIPPVPAAAAEAKKPTKQLRLAVTSGNGKLTVRVTTRPRSSCKLRAAARGGKSARFPATRTDGRGKATFKWAVPSNAPSGRWTFTIRCRSNGKTRTAKRRALIITSGNGRGDLIEPSSLHLDDGTLGGRGAGAPCAKDENGGNVCFSGNPFDTYRGGPYTGECTWYAAGRRPDLWGKTTGNAKQWLDQARARGVQIGGSPAVGAIAVQTGGVYGHVMYVTAVTDNGATIIVDDSNYRNDHVVRYGRRVAANTIAGYIYGGPAGGGSANGTNPGATTPGGGGAAPPPAPATPPSLAGSGWQTAFQANDGSLWTVGGDNRGAMNLGMAPDTSPSITRVAGGGWQTAFQASDNSLWVIGKDNKGAMNLGMKPGTSPSIAGLSTGGWESAFQSPGGTLWIVGADTKGDMGLGMAPDTSPSIAGVADGGWQTAFQASDNSLWIVGKDNRGAMNLGMKPGTNPSITGVEGGGWQTAFQAPNGSLWVIGKDTKGDMGLGMAPGTSPSITGMAGGGWQAAFQASDNSLWVVGKDNKGAMNLGMAPGTSPSITGLAGGGWEVAFQAPDGGLWVVGSDSKGALNLGMAPNTSPAITSYSPG